MQISPIDLAILILYLAGITLFGAYFRRGQNSLRDYFLGGRTAPCWAIACSIVATETSTLTIISTPGIAYGGNLKFLQIVLGYLVARVILCVVLIPQYFQGEFYTAYQLLEKRFGTRMRSAAAVVFLVTRALAEGVRISAIGKVVSVAFGTGERISILIIALLTLLYTFEGGMRAVIWTDVIQFALYLTGSLAAFLLLLHKIPGGWLEVTRVAAAAGGKLTIFDFAFSLTKSYTFWAGILGGTFLTMASHGTDQTLVQRLLAARNEKDSKTALLASGVIVFVQFSLFLVLGVMLFVFAQHGALQNPGNDPDRLRSPSAGRSCRTCAGVDFCDGDVKRQWFVELACIVEHHRHRKAADRSRTAATTPFAHHDACVGYRSRAPWTNSLGTSASRRPHNYVDYIWGHAGCVFARDVEPARK
jgi:Na+/proline symporter